MARSNTTRHGNGEGLGAGWGGPAKGAGYAGPDGTREAYSAGEMRPGQGAGTGHMSIAGIDKRARDEERAERMEAVLDDIAEHGRIENARVAAANALLNRIKGMPIATNLNVNRNDLDTLTDEQLRDELRRSIAEDARARDGDVPPPLPN